MKSAHLVAVTVLTEFVVVAVAGAIPLIVAQKLAAGVETARHGPSRGRH